jgi:two-component system response regulator RegX3
VPIIMVTAKDSETDKVLGLELGADDYVTKPFALRELVARIRAVLRRAATPEGDGPPPGGEIISAGDVVMDVDAHVVTVKGERVTLPLKEFQLLEVLLDNAGHVVARHRLIDIVWGEDYHGDTKTLDVHIKRLRSHIEADPAVPVHIVTVRGVGYKFENRPRTG